jgi:hypothetical protein
MKKFLALVVLCLAMITAQAAVPASIQSIVDEYNTSIAGTSEDGVLFGKSFISGNDIIIPMYMDDAELVEAGFTLAEAIDMMGGTDAIAQIMLESLFEDPDSKSDPEIVALKRYQYDLVVRMIGSTSKTQVDARVRYQSL